LAKASLSVQRILFFSQKIEVVGQNIANSAEHAGLPMRRKQISSVGHGLWSSIAPAMDVRIYWIFWSQKLDSCAIFWFFQSKMDLLSTIEFL